VTPQDETPRALGFRMPAEWEPHEATWLAWPHNHEDWPGKFAPIPWVYAEIAARLSRVERVRILIAGDAARRRASEQLRKTGARLEAIELIECATNRGWTRDYCPLFVRDAAGAVAATKWRFNGWAKYRNWRADDAAFDTLAPRLGMRSWRTGLVLEGGAIDVNGGGLLLATEECLLSPIQERNPGLGRDGIEHALAEYLGIENVLWLARGITGDDTHGHIDDLARFVSPTTIAIASESDSTEANHGLLVENLARLRAMTGPGGLPFDVVTLPMPRPVFFDGQRLPASYLNFYIANGLVLVPTFNDPQDRVALATLAALFPDREVTGIYCGDLVLGLGTLHCMTMQQPAANR
jgi:agmatine deiminase